MIALITATGGRPWQFDLCQKFMKRQTYNGDVLWIIVDDCYPRSTDIVQPDFKEKWQIVKAYPSPPWRVGQNTQGRNIEAGLDELKKYPDIETIFIIEDDDYYRPIYLERMMSNWSACKILGETKTIYYNPITRRYAVNPNTGYASLFQTAFSRELIPLLKAVKGNRFIDGALWKVATDKKLFHENDLAIGIKGLPGRAGIGAGHSNSYYGMIPDIEMKFLKSKIGDDADIYKDFYKVHGIPRRNRPDILTRR